MEVLSPLRLGLGPGPDRYLGFDHSRLSIEEAWYHPSFDQSVRFGPKPPPSPPEEMSSRISLPSIADILNPSRDDDSSTDRQRLTRHVRQSASHGEGQTKVQAQQPPSSHLPPTPPMSLATARRHDSQPLPTLQPQHISHIDSNSFSPEARYQRTVLASTNEQKHVLNTNVASFPSPPGMTAPPLSAQSHGPRGQKRRSEAPHTRRSRSPPVYMPRTRTADTPKSLPSSSSVSMNRSLSSEFPAQQAPHRRSLQKDFPPPSTPSITMGTNIPRQRSLHLDYPPQSQTQPLFQQPYSPQSSPSSTKTSVYDSRVRSMSWQQQQAPPPPPPQQQQHAQHHPSSPYSSRPQTSSSSSVGVPLAGAPTDRYICSTCGKCFSRPSSLRIHSHSHTGEKPFRCSREGCGKAFSVRSNMKRHEKGCHAAVIVGPGYMSSAVGVSGVSVSVLPPQAQPVGLGVRGLPSLSATLPGTRELAPALDSS